MVLRENCMISISPQTVQSAAAHHSITRINLSSKPSCFFNPSPTYQRLR